MRKRIACGIILFASLLVGTAWADKSMNQQLLDAAFIGDKAKVEALIASGADVNAKEDEYGRTPLHQAVRGHDDISVIELLIVKGADVNAKDNNGRAPITYAEYNPDLVKLLIAKGADVNARDKDGYPLSHYLTNYWILLTLAEHTADIKAFIKDLNITERSKGSCIDLATDAIKGNKNRLELDLALSDFDINCEDGLPLYSAIINEHADVVEVLLGHGAKPYSAKFDFIDKAFNSRAIVTMLQEAKAKSQITQAGSSHNNIQQLLIEFKGHSDIETIRKAIIDLALKVNPAPAIPPEAEAAAGRAAYIFKNAKSADDTLRAAKEYLTAIEAAPWVANYYYNLCTVLEKTPYTQQALHACKLYLVAAPDAADAGDMQQRIAGLQFATDRDKAQMKQRTAYHGTQGRNELYIFGGISADVLDKKFALKMTVDWPSQQYMVGVFCIQSDGAYGTVHDMVSTDRWIGMCKPEANMHLVIKPEGGGYVEVSNASGEGIRTTLTALFEAKQKTLAQSGILTANGDRGERFYVEYLQGGKGDQNIGYSIYETDCNGSLLKQDLRTLPDDFITNESAKKDLFKGSFAEYDNHDHPNACTDHFSSTTGYHFGENE